MSMLTPPGMGGKYRITGNRYPRMRRPKGRRKRVLSLVGSVAAVALIGWGTLQLIDVFSGDDGGDSAQAAHSAADCKRDGGPPTQRRALPKPADITVNVYNATKRTGLAKETADKLKKRGFKIGKVGNATAEYDKKIKASGLLLGAPSATKGTFGVLSTQVHGTKTKNDTRKGKDVDLIIGDAFKDLVTKKDADKAMASLTKPTPTPSRTAC